MANTGNELGGQRPPDIRDFIFVRELAEVYLLLDHISGRWDKPLDAEGEELRAAICRIGWPPNGSRVDAAEQAATLLRAKDRLNALARPACGATIAFTLLVVGEEDPRRQNRWWWWRLFPWDKSARRGPEGRMPPLVAPAHPVMWGHPVTPPATPPAPPPVTAPTFARAPRPAPVSVSTAIPDTAPGTSMPAGQAPQSPAALDPHGVQGPHVHGVAGQMQPACEPAGADLIVSCCGFTRPPTRMSLARTAFPGLIGPASHFNRGIWRIVMFLIIWMVLTCVLSWDITAGNVVLAHLDTLRTQQAELARKISAAEAADELARRNKAGASAAADVTPSLFCEPVTERYQRKYRTVEELQLCTDKDRLDNERMVTQRNLQIWIRPWYSLMNFESAEPKAGGPPNIDSRYGGDEEPARVLTHVIGCAVLPLCYGILGAGAAAVRNLWAKLRESMLMPRDYTLALGQLALGATIGACIGLFVNPSGAASGTDMALASSWTLSGSALSFIAGFGVEGVFRALEAFVQRVFGVPVPPDGQRTP